MLGFRGKKDKAEKVPRVKAGAVEFTSSPAESVDQSVDEGGEPAEEARPLPAANDVAEEPAAKPLAKPAKPAKAPKPAKAEKRKKVTASEEEELPPIPKHVNIDFYQGIDKESEAEQIARAWIEQNFMAPNASYLYTQRWRGGIAVEVHEGGGQAFLPEVLAKLDEDPSSIIAVPMSGRYAQVWLDPETKALETLIQVANTSPPPEMFRPLPTKPMKAFDRRGSRVFVAGGALLVASLIATVFSVGAFFIDTKAWSIPYTAQTAVKDLPTAEEQMAKVNSALASGDCVYKMEYSGGVWNITSGFDNGGVCGLVRAAPIVEEQAAPEVADAGAAAASMTPGVGAVAPASGIPATPQVGPATMPGGPALAGGGNSGSVSSGPGSSISR